MIQLIEGERILYKVRKHWWVLLSDSLIAVILFIIPWIFFFGIETLNVPLDGGAGSLLFFIGMLWLFISWLIFVIIWTNYYLDAWLVTNRRVVDIEQISLFKRDFSEFRLDRIQDITIQVKGIIPTLMHFGDIHVQTAGEDRDFIIKGIPDPFSLRDILFEEHNKVIEERIGKDIDTEN